jgi:hypothetical protein
VRAELVEEESLLDAELDGLEAELDRASNDLISDNGRWLQG